jgi:DNA-binding GntR family transcriptional regulator
MTGYAEIAAHFRKLIAAGDLKPGDRLPTLREVMTSFGVAQQTAARAYRLLRDEGLTSATTGKGTMVAEPSSPTISARLLSWASTGRALAANETSKILAVETVGADELIAHRLGVEPGSPVHVRRRLVSRDGVPVHLSSSYYPAYVIEATPELAEPVSTGGSRELAAERLGADQDRVLEEVTSRHATEDEKAALGLTGQVVVSQVLRTVLLTDGRVVEVAVRVLHGSTVLRWSTSLR